MQLRMHPDALAEFAFAVAHYERQQAGLGLRFLANVESALQHIAADPLAWPLRSVLLILWMAISRHSHFPSKYHWP